jgi:hypothetical protein
MEAKFRAMEGFLTARAIFRFRKNSLTISLWTKDPNRNSRLRRAFLQRPS